MPLAADTAQMEGHPAWPLQLRDDMARLANVEWRLRESAGDLCPGKAPAIGIKFDYIGAYAGRDRPYLAGVLGLGDLPQVAAVVPGSPADGAGIRPGDDVVAIDGVDVMRIAAAADDPDLLADELEKYLVQSDKIDENSLVIRRDGEEKTIRVKPAILCLTRFVLKTGSAKDAYSDSRNIALTTGMIRFTANDDELALIAGHELGHVVARHGKAKGLGERRRMEDEADSLGAALAHCAGYDVSASTDFWMRYHRQDWLRWFRDPSHRGAKSRAKRLVEQAGGLSCPVTLQGLVDRDD